MKHVKQHLREINKRWSAQARAQLSTTETGPQEF